MSDPSRRKDYPEDRNNRESKRPNSPVRDKSSKPPRETTQREDTNQKGYDNCWLCKFRRNL